MKLFILSILLTCSVFGSDYVLVISSNSSVTHVSEKQIRDIFMMKLHYINDAKIVPINISASAPIRQIFEKNVLKVDRQRLNNYWIKEHFQGVSPPLTQPSPASVKMFVKNVEGAVGYVPSDMIDSDLRVIYEF